MAHTGTGGSVTKDAVNVASVGSYSYRESEGSVYGQKQSDVSL